MAIKGLLQLIPNRFLVDLVNIGLRNILYEINRFGGRPFIDFAVIHELLQVVLDILGTGLLTGLQGDQGVWAFAPFFIGHASIGDRRVLADQVSKSSEGSHSPPVLIPSLMVMVLSGSMEATSPV